MAPTPVRRCRTHTVPCRCRSPSPGGRITAVNVPQYPSGGRSDEINARAVPTLVSETLGAQSARVDMVSGATFTSEGYTTSLQNALDQARA
ncbi:FMN-binding protein [Acidipropionibacterium jensenii]|uniref:FMN-binding protein n=1 Tax=Acidipropionibacterium jensenii TaxID=1749 RepID=UPI0035A2FEA8